MHSFRWTVFYQWYQCLGVTGSLLQPDQDKTEILLFFFFEGTGRESGHKKFQLNPSQQATADSELSFKAHVGFVTKIAFYHLKKNIQMLFLSNTDSDDAFIFSRLA